MRVAVLAGINIRWGPENLPSPGQDKKPGSLISQLESLNKK